MFSHLPKFQLRRSPHLPNLSRPRCCFWIWLKITLWKHALAWTQLGFQQNFVYKWISACSDHPVTQLHPNQRCTHSYKEAIKGHLQPKSYLVHSQLSVCQIYWIPPHTLFSLNHISLAGWLRFKNITRTRKRKYWLIAQYQKLSQVSAYWHLECTIADCWRVQSIRCEQDERSSFDDYSKTWPSINDPWFCSENRILSAPRCLRLEHQEVHY